jgi:hypothetical protein
MDTTFENKKEELIERSLAEILDVRVHPDLAFQSYECLKSDAKKRKASQEAFVKGETNTITLEYINLPEEGDMQRRIKQLDGVLARVDEIEDPREREATFSSVAFRQAEMYFTLTVSRLNRLVKAYNFVKQNRPDDQELGVLEEKIKAEADRYREQNAMLYGLPNDEEHKKVCGEIRAILNAKSYHPDAALIYDQLNDGFEARDRRIAPLIESDDRLPSLSDQAEQWVKAFVYKEYDEYWQLVKSYWDNVIVPRSREAGVEPVFDVKLDMVPLFCSARTMLDPTDSMGIGVNEDPNSGSLAWDTPSMAVVAGTAPRSDLIDSPQKAFGKIYHELFGGHGGRAVGGLKTGIPIAAYGVFTEEETSAGDYITYEEGQNKIVETVLRRDNKPGSGKWSFEDVRHTFTIGLEMLEGRTTAEAYELAWRVHLLSNLKDNQEPTIAMIEKSKIAVARYLERPERSRPADLPDFAGLIVFTKDLMYARGQIIATSPIEEWAGRNDIESFRNAHTMKTDPTQPKQYKLMEHAGRPVRLNRFEEAA